ncbi:MAG: SDR family NAD(P)-dependent oxidoreductase, partial [Pseudomonadota bacterium]|nr:SDR family NAD(P)-dependent oxidoreductase [Pseudomonadota bacterium]
MIPISDGAAIVTVGSVLGKMAQPGVAAYAASKAGLAVLTRTLSSEGISKNIRANMVIPGMFKTPMN